MGEVTTAMEEEEKALHEVSSKEQQDLRVKVVLKLHFISFQIY